MSVFLARRFLSFLITVSLASVIVFLLLEVLPGDPALTMLGVDAPDSAIEALRLELGLDRPAIVRYAAWIAGLFQGEMGLSYVYRVPVTELIGQRLHVTLPLAIGAMVVATLASLTLGIFAATNHNRVGDYGVMGFSQLGLAIPDFWFGILLIILFAVILHWLPSGGFPGWDDGIWHGVRSLLLPILTQALSLTAIMTRVTRSSVLEVAREDYVRTARAKGLSRRAALWGHVLRNALIPVLTIGGLLVATVVTGTLVIENVFALPGVGKLIFDAISNRDLMVVKNVVLLFAAIVVAVNFVVDILYAMVDPRIRVHT
ncbi:MAG: ABC transporter permease [Rhodospirillaceae bacterium]|jgi:peptide/nickel transport system permease protein|nr:ABC transporter permease [Rhodospirillaceae bacterium]MBT3494038.1 ABC transporter permease [Rhodospirillaceae bacterium]MBT3779668.1 ABC transporter permease [Rhodospirillaceae bacterium]MBT3976965.1 ABC transporter permease [Rhodospirillaceae bacterium]MBT4171505.1 ABC transporter permease [Rhodospirillaceae bacterium]